MGPNPAAGERSENPLKNGVFYSRNGNRTNFSLRRRKKIPPTKKGLFGWLLDKSSPSPFFGKPSAKEKDEEPPANQNPIKDGSKTRC